MILSMKSITTSPSARILVAAFAVWLVLGAAQASVILALGEVSTAWTTIAVMQMTHAITWTMITLAVRWSSSLLSSRPRSVRLVGHLLALVAAGVADALVRRASAQLLVGDVTVSFARTLLYYADVTTLSYALAWWLARVIDAREALIAQTKHELTLRSQLARARLEYLHAQLQPHFLFNALGAVSELIFENPDGAVRTFRQLTSVLRTAAARSADEIPLREEVAALMPYVEVQRARFSDWLEIDIEVDEAAADARVPPLILQPLVENSIRHGLQGRSSRGVITITARAEAGRLLLSVRDNGAGLAGRTASRAGVGLSNTTERVRTLYGDKGSLRVFNDAHGGTVAEISLPVVIHAVAEDKADALVAVDAPQPQPQFIDRHPVAALAIGFAAATILWSQQSYSYLLMSGRVGDRSFFDLVREDFILVALWTAMVPIVVIVSRRVPIAGRMWVLASLAHLVVVSALALAHSLGVLAYRGADQSLLLSTLREGAAITLLVYLGVVAYTQRELLHEWTAERRLAASKLGADIVEARVAAATLAVTPQSLDATLAALERHVHSDPLEAERAVARLGNELRAALEQAGQPGRAIVPSGSGLAPAGEYRVESFAMGA